MGEQFGSREGVRVGRMEQLQGLDGQILRPRVAMPDTTLRGTDFKMVKGTGKPGRGGWGRVCGVGMLFKPGCATVHPQQHLAFSGLIHLGSASGCDNQ